jgi:hypothetical protein
VKSSSSFPGLFQLEVTAADGDGNLSPAAAQVSIHIAEAGADIAAPLFQQRIYRFTAAEDAGLHSALGSVGLLRGGSSETAVARLFLYPGLLFKGQFLRNFFSPYPGSILIPLLFPPFLKLLTG